MSVNSFFSSPSNLGLTALACVMTGFAAKPVARWAGIDEQKAEKFRNIVFSVGAIFGFSAIYQRANNTTPLSVSAIISNQKPPSLFDRMIRGSGVVSQKDFTGILTKNVTTVEMSGVGNAVIHQGEKLSLTVKADDNIIPILNPLVRGNKLTLGFVQNSFFSTSNPIQYNVELPRLERVVSKGTTTLTVPKLEGNSFSCSIHGTGNLKILSGKVETQNIEVSGAGVYNALSLTSDFAKVKVSGASRALICAAKSLTGAIFGAGSCIYTGNPAVAVNRSSSATCTKI